jgi:Pyruvate/2-oxoacid:ferredoxin oxidoreductase delta subunit
MNKALVGSPKTDEFLDILRIRFTSEEAEMALLLPLLPQELSVIAQSANKTVEEIKPMLEQMADKGLVYKQTIIEAGKTLEFYYLFGTIMGIWETSFAKGEKNPQTEQLAHLWRQYYDSGWGKEQHRTKTPVARIIPVEQSIESQREVVPYERASELMKDQDYFAVIHCPCRSAAQLTGKGCGKPTEVCLHWGDMAKYFVERNFGRKIDKQEAFDILNMTEKAGLVHLTINTQEGCFAICSCCSCCCNALRAIAELPKPGAVANSMYFPVLDQDKCSACGVCEDRCHVDAIAVIDEAAKVEKDKCIGCGLCATTCPDEAITLCKREDYKGPFTTIEKMAEAIITERMQ